MEDPTLTSMFCLADYVLAVTLMHYTKTAMNSYREGATKLGIIVHIRICFRSARHPMWGLISNVTGNHIKPHLN